MIEIVRILTEEMEIMQRTNRVNSPQATNIQDSSKFNTWSQVPKHHLLKDKNVVKSLKKSAISKYNRFQTLHYLQRTTDNATPETENKERIVHQKVPSR